MNAVKRARIIAAFDASDDEWVRVGLEPHVGGKSLASAVRDGLIERHPEEGPARPMDWARYRLAETEVDLGDLWIE